METRILPHLLSAAFVVASSQIAEAKTLISISWRLVEVEQAPRSATRVTRNSVSYILDGNTISRSDGRVVARLGGSAQGTNSHNAAFQNDYSVANGVISIRTRFAGSIVTTIIRTDGTRSCTATIDYRPAPGQAAITTHRISNHEPMVIEFETADDIQCRIAAMQ